MFINDEEIVTTPSHPFYRPNHGWTDAIDLRAGDKLVTVNGEYVVVEMVQHEILEEPIKVYNFQVEDYHTYYVSDEDVLVHNSCNHDKKWASERRKHWRDQGQFYKDKIDKTAMSDNNLFPLTEENVNRMLRGSAPIGKDGKSVVLHHRQGIKNSFDDYIEMTCAR